MSVRSFSDLGKNVRNVLKSGYTYGKRLINLNIRTAQKGFEIKCNLGMDCGMGESMYQALYGESTTKLKLQDYGVFTQKWSTDGTLSFEYTDASQSSSSSAGNVVAGISCNLTNDKCEVKLASNFVNEYINVATKFSTGTDRVAVNVAVRAVVPVKDVLLGYEIGYNAMTKSLSKSQLVLDYTYKKVNLTIATWPGFGGYEGSLAYKVSERLEAAFSAGLQPARAVLLGPDDTLVPVMLEDLGGDILTSYGIRFQISTQTAMRVMIDSKLHVSTNFEHEIRKGIRVTVALGIDANDHLGGDHHVGLSIDVDA